VAGYERGAVRAQLEAAGLAYTQTTGEKNRWGFTVGRERVWRRPAPPKAAPAAPAAPADTTLAEAYVAALKSVGRLPAQPGPPVDWLSPLARDSDGGEEAAQ
jgi:hypothetical protein